VPGGGPLKRTPGPVDALTLEPCRNEPVLKIRAVNLIVANGNGCVTTPTNQGMAARQRALRSTQIEDTEAHAHPSRAIRAYAAPINEDFILVRSTQYAVGTKSWSFADSCCQTSITDRQTDRPLDQDRMISWVWKLQ